MKNFEHYLQYINRDKYPKLIKIVNKGIEAEENYDRERFNTTMMLCRQVIESIMKVIAEDKGIVFNNSIKNTTLMEMMNELVNKMGWGDYYKAKLHGTRMLGNDAIHDIDNDSPEEAFNAIKDVYTLFDLLYKLYYAPKHFQEKSFSLINEENVTVLDKKEILPKTNELNIVHQKIQTNTSAETVNHTEESKLNDNEQRWTWWLSLTPQQKEFLLVDVLQIETFNMQYAEQREIMEAYNYLNDLFELTEITFVDVQNPSIDLSLFNNFKNLEKLTMSHCKFDMMQLIQLKQLKSLDISHNNISDISLLVALTDLQGLNLSHNQIIDIRPLSKLQLKSLDISHNNISDIIPLIVFKDLQRLNLSHNQIRDISPLSKL